MYDHDPFTTANMKLAVTVCCQAVPLGGTAKGEKLSDTDKPHFAVNETMVHLRLSHPNPEAVVWARHSCLVPVEKLIQGSFKVVAKALPSQLSVVQ